jgi:hypothetical protein
MTNFIKNLSVELMYYSFFKICLQCKVQNAMGVNTKPKIFAYHRLWEFCFLYRSV